MNIAPAPPAHYRRVPTEDRLSTATVAYGKPEARSIASESYEQESYPTAPQAVIAMERQDETQNQKLIRVKIGSSFPSYKLLLKQVLANIVATDFASSTLAPEADEEATTPDVFSPSYPYKTLFTEVREFRLSELPRLTPHIVIDDHHFEPDDE